MRRSSVAVLALLACSTGPVVSQSIRDSAGVRIVDNGRVAWSPRQAWRLSPGPLLEIGVVEGDPRYQLYRARFVQRLSDGGIVLANTGSHEIRAYTADGIHRFSAGGAGEGPGEFRSISFLGVLPGDTLVAHDRDLDRVSFFAPDGEFIRSFRLEPLQGIGDPWVRGLFDTDLLWVAYARSFRGTGDGHHRNFLFYTVHDLEGTLRHGFGELIFSQMWVVNEPNRSSYLSIPYGPFSAHSIAGDSLAHGWSDAPEVEIYDRTGRLRRSIRWKAEPVPVRSGDLRDFQERYYAGNDERSRRIRAAHEEMPIPATKPYYSDLLLDRTGHLWVANYRWGGDRSRSWQVFDPRGRWLGEVVGPQDFTPRDIGEDWVLGTFVDDFDVQHVLLYRLDKPAH